MDSLRRFMIALVLVWVAIAAACTTIGAGSPSPPADRPEVVTGEVEGIDETRREIELSTEDRLRYYIAYETDTPVFYRGEEYRVANLELGDVVRVELDERERDLLAERIVVEESVQERRGGAPSAPEPAAQTLVGEIERVDSDRREIELVTEGRAERVFVGYHSQTPVFYGGEEYRVVNLEPGDLVRVHLEDDRPGSLEADWIEVERSRQERGGEGVASRRGDVETLTGTVESIESRHGEFFLRTPARGIVVVKMPFDAAASDREAFEELRRGDAVRIDAERIGEDSYLLVRFD